MTMRTPNPPPGSITPATALARTTNPIPTRPAGDVNRPVPYSGRR